MGPTRALLAILLLLLAGCYRPSSTITSDDTSTETHEDPGQDTSVEVTDTAGEDLPDDPDQEEVTEVIEDVAEEDPAVEIPDHPELPVTYAPDFTLEDLNPNSPTYGAMRSIWGERGKVILIYFGSYG